MFSSLFIVDMFNIQCFFIPSDYGHLFRRSRWKLCEELKDNTLSKELKEKPDVSKL